MTGKGSVNHNSRKFHAKNTDPERSCLNVEYCNENAKDVYHELFDEALARYNAKQARSDRRIDDYYEKICSGKQEKPFHEIILQIGDKDNMGAKTENGQLAAKVLDKYMQDFQRRNPTLKVFSAYLHMDEATPHLHIDYSENYCFSYPSMLELLTVCSDETAKKRKPFTNPVLPVDIICLENKPKDEGKNFSSQEIKNDYKKYFTNLRQKVGDRLWENNHHEEECYEEGLRSLYNNDEERVKAAVEGIKQAYDSSQMVNFYPSVAMIVREVRKKSNLYGNYIDASKYNEENRFKQDSENAIYMFDKDNGEPEVLDETEAVESAGDVAETAATAEAVEDINDAANTQDLSDDLLYYDSAIGRDNMLGGIVILKGSKISRSEANSCPEGAKKKRNSSLLDGSITDDGEYYVLQKDMEFRSLSGAACFVSGTSVNGKLAWKSEKKNAKTVGKSSSGVRSTGVSSKINQICMVIEKVNQENKPIENYTKTLQNIYGAVASELNISKSPVVDKCNRQLGLTAMEFAKYVRDYSEEGKDTLYDIVMNAAGNEDEKALIRKTFKKN